MSTEFVLAVHQLISCVLSLEKQEPTVKAPNTSVMALKRMWEVGGGGGDTPRKGISPALDQNWLLEVALRLWSEQSCGRRLFCGKESWARIWGWPVASSGDLRSRIWWRTVREWREGVEGVLVMEPTRGQWRITSKCLRHSCVHTVFQNSHASCSVDTVAAWPEAVVGGRKRLDLGDVEETEWLDLAVGWLREQVVREDLQVLVWANCDIIQQDKCASRALGGKRRT